MLTAGAGLINGRGLMRDNKAVRLGGLLPILGVLVRDRLYFWDRLTGSHIAVFLRGCCGITRENGERLIVLVARQVAARTPILFLQLRPHQTVSRRSSIATTTANAPTLGPKTRLYRKRKIVAAFYGHIAVPHLYGGA